MKSNFLKKVWYFVWYEDSLLSWLVNVFLAFILVKFVLYPVLGLVFGTQYPLVAVVSCSMEHNSDFSVWWDKNNDWYINNNITEEQFYNFSFKNGINQGDIMILKNVLDPYIGDVIVFRGSGENPIIHRLVNIKNNNLITKGDNNFVQDRNTGQVLGKAIFRVPYLGWIKIFFNGLIGQKIIKC